MVRHSLALLASTLVRSNEQRRRGCRENGVIQRRFDAKRNCHRGSKQNQQHCAAQGDPYTPDSQDQSSAEEEFRCRSCPRQKWNRGGWHEGVHFSGVAHKACKISVADISPTIESKAVSNPRKERSTERNARTESRPTQPVRPTRFVSALTRFHLSRHSCGVYCVSPFRPSTGGTLSFVSWSQRK